MRKQVEQYYLMESNLKSMAMQMATMQSTAEINTALRAATSTMSAANEKMDVKDVQQIMKNFTRESEKLGIKMDFVRKARFSSMLFLDARYCRRCRRRSRGRSRGYL